MARITDDGLRLIKHFEGFFDKPYICPAGYKTIGYGHVIRPGENFDTLTEDEAEELLLKDIMVAERAIQRLIYVPLTDYQWDALTSFTFNLGSGALQRSTLRQKVNREEHIDVPDEFRKWVYAGGRKLKGLVRRREAEALLYSGIVTI
jgi:lysozyme